MKMISKFKFGAFSLLALALAISSCEKEKLVEDQVQEQTELEKKSKSVKIFTEDKLGYVIATVTSEDDYTIEQVTSEFENSYIKGFSEEELNSVNNMQEEEEVVSAEEDEKTTEMKSYDLHIDYTNVLERKRDGVRMAYGLVSKDKARYSSSVGWFYATGVIAQVSVNPIADAAVVVNETKFFHLGCVCHRRFSDFTAHDDAGVEIFKHLSSGWEMIPIEEQNSVKTIKASSLKDTYGEYSSKMKVTFLYD